MDHSGEITVKGAKGGKGGGGGGGAVESDDTLRSDAYAGFIDLLGEGEWQGLVDGMKSIIINGTRYMNADGSTNFTAERIETRNGTQNQLPLSDFFGNVENVVSVGTEVRIDSGAVIRSISDSDVDKVRVIVTFPQLTKTNTSNGNIEGTRVEYAIDVQSAGGGFVEKKRDTVAGKKNGSYQRQYEIDIGALAKPVDIRLRRITPDVTTSYESNKIVWDTYTEIITAKLSYPNSVLVAMRLSAAQFTSIPSRAYEVKMLRIQVPTNYDPITRLYTGSWDGNFKIAWSNNPAWCFYDMLTANRYGLGDFIDASQVDKWALYSIGRYCDELVDDGFGGKEPRFVLNTLIADRNEAFNVMQDMAGCFRGLTYWQAGQISVAQDAPGTASRLFSRANVIDGKFLYQGSSKKTRFTAVAVAWNDPKDMYKRKLEYVEDVDGIATYGFLEKPDGLTAFGCTSRGQAVRLGKWYLLNNLLETETVTFRIGQEGATLRPAELIKVMDNSRAGKQASGRTSNSTTTTVTVDRDVVLNDSTNYVMHCAISNGGVITVESQPVLSAVGRVITVAAPFSAAPQKAGVWILTSDALAAQTYRVVGVVEDQGQYEVTALKCTVEKYAALENGLLIEPAPISTLQITPDQPAAPTASESLYADASQVKVVLTLDWQPSRMATYYEVVLTQPDGNVIALPLTANSAVDIRDAVPGVYGYSIKAVGANGNKSTPAIGSYEVKGKLTPPKDVQNFVMFPTSGNLATFTWDATTDLDVSIGGYVRIRHSPLTDGSATPSVAIDIGNAVAGSATECSLPLLTGTYFAQFIDSSGKVSENAAEIITTVPNILNLNVIDTLLDSPNYDGTKVNTFVDTVLGGLAMAGAAYIDDLPEIDSITGTLDYQGGIAVAGSYESSEVVDLGAVYDVRLTSLLETATADIGTPIDSRNDLIDSWPDIDGSESTAGNAWIEISTTRDDPAGPSPAWDDWRRFHAGEYPFRGLKRRLQLRCADDTTTIYVTQCGLRMDLADRLETKSNIVSGAAPFTVNYDFAFWTTPTTPGITMLNGTTGDYFLISNETAGSFRITFYNSAGTIVSRTFAYAVKGQGKRQ